MEAGDVLFSSFLIGWVSTMYLAAQNTDPVELFDFERQFLADGGKNEDYEWTVQGNWEMWIRENFWIPAACSIMYFVMLRSFEPIMAEMERPAWLKPLTFFW